MKKGLKEVRGVCGREGGEGGNDIIILREAIISLFLRKLSRKRSSKTCFTHVKKKTNNPPKHKQIEWEGLARLLRVKAVDARLSI